MQKSWHRVSQTMASVNRAEVAARMAEMGWDDEGNVAAFRNGDIESSRCPESCTATWQGPTSPQAQPWTWKVAPVSNLAAAAGRFSVSRS